MAASISQTEQMRSTALNTARYRKQNIQQEVRKGLFQSTAPQEEPETVPEQSQYKQRLAMLKAGSIKRANTELGSKAGATAGSAIGSIIPVLGTGIGFFLGRFIGRKLGITGIIIISLILLAFCMTIFFIIFIGALKGYCDTYVGTAVDYITMQICPSFQ